MANVATFDTLYTYILLDKLPTPVEQESTLYIYGIMGFIQLLSGDYMLTITEREVVGSIKGKSIYRIGAFQILPLARHLDALSEEEVR